jgi:hypothetical protein
MPEFDRPTLPAIILDYSRRVASILHDVPRCSKMAAMSIEALNIPKNISQVRENATMGENRRGYYEPQGCDYAHQYQ